MQGLLLEDTQYVLHTYPKSHWSKTTETKDPLVHLLQIVLGKQLLQWPAFLHLEISFAIKGLVALSWSWIIATGLKISFLELLLLIQVVSSISCFKEECWIQVGWMQTCKVTPGEALFPVFPFLITCSKINVYTFCIFLLSSCPLYFAALSFVVDKKANSSLQQLFSHSSVLSQ